MLLGLIKVCWIWIRSTRGTHLSVFNFNTFFPSCDLLFSPSSCLPRVRKRWNLCMLSLVTSKHWNTLFGRTTSPKRVSQCCRLSCPGKGVTEWANQQARCRYKIQHLPSCLLDLSAYYTSILLHSVVTVSDAHWWSYIIVVLSGFSRAFFCVMIKMFLLL